MASMSLSSSPLKTFGSQPKNFEVLLNQEDFRGMMNTVFQELKSIKLSALEKYQQSGKFPFKVFLQVVLAIISSFQVLLIIKTDTEYTREQMVMFKQNFLGLDEPDYYTQVFTMDDTIKMMSNMFIVTIFPCLTSFFLKKKTSDELNRLLYNTLDANNTNATLSVAYQAAFSNKDVFSSDLNTNFWQKNVEIYSLNDLPFDLTNVTSFHEFVQGVSEMNFEITGLTLYGFIGTERQYCANWTTNIFMDLITYSSIYVEFRADKEDCNGFKNLTRSTYIIPVLFSVAGFFLGLSALILNLKHIIHSLDYYTRNSAMQGLYSYLKTKKKENENSLLTSQLFVGNKMHEDMKAQFSQTKKVRNISAMRLKDWWNYANLLGSFCQVVSSSLLFEHYYLKPSVSFDHMTSILGCAALLNWLCIIRYIAMADKTIIIVPDSIERILGQVGTLSLGILPIFAFFILFFITSYNNFTRFGTLFETTISFISITFGDIIFDSFTLIKTSGSTGTIMLTLFIVVFFSSMQSLFVLVFMEGYDDTQRERNELRKMERKKKKIYEKYEETDPEEEEALTRDINRLMNRGLFLEQSESSYISEKETASKSVHRTITVTGSTARKLTKVLTRRTINYSLHSDGKDKDQNELGSRNNTQGMDPMLGEENKGSFQEVIVKLNVKNDEKETGSDEDKLVFQANQETSNLWAFWLIPAFFAWS